MPASLPGLDACVGKSVFRKGKAVGCIQWSWGQLVRSSVWSLGFCQLLRLLSRRQAGSHGLAGSLEQSDLLFGGLPSKLQALCWAGVGKAGATSSPFARRCGGNSPAPSQLCPDTEGNQDPCRCPKTGLFSSSLSSLPWKDPCTLQVDVLVVPHPPSQQNQVVYFFPGISTGLLAINPDPHVKSRALGALLLALTHLSPLCVSFPVDKKQVEGSSLMQ